MKDISIVVATDQKNAIGKNNQLLWHLPNDLKFFKKITSGGTIIMGRKTYNSIGKPLLNRRNIVISRQDNLVIEGVEVFNSIEKAIQACENENEIFIIGGAEIYKQALPLTTKVYLTQVHHIFEADTYLTGFSISDWQLISKEDHYKDEKHLYNYSFLILKKP